MAKSTVTVKVQLIVEVDCGPWDAEASYASISETCAKEAHNRVSRVINDTADVTIVGGAQCISVTMQRTPEGK